MTKGRPSLARKPPLEAVAEAVDELEEDVDEIKTGNTPARSPEPPPTAEYQRPLPTEAGWAAARGVQFRALLNSPRSPYAAIRRLALYGFLLCVCGAGIAWLVASLGR